MGGVLGHLADRAAVQIASLRAALDQAARVEEALGRRVEELARRLDQAARFEKEFDRRLEAASRATVTLDQAGAALSGLERVVAELRSAGEAIGASVQRQLDAQQARVESMLAEQREALAARLAEISDQSARAADQARAAASEAEAEAARLRARLSCGLRAEADLLAAALERQGAQVNARIAIALDDASQRIADLERSAERAAQAAAERFERSCEHAAVVLGHDPRQTWHGAEPHESPKAGSLADLTARAEAAAHTAEEALVRLSVATDRASQAQVRVDQAAERLGAIDQAEARLAGLRDDIESAASSVRHGLSQAQQAEAILEKTIERARGKAEGLDRAMDQVTQQAASMVQVARDVGGLVVRADAVRAALAELLAQAEACATPPVAQVDRGRLRRAPTIAPAHPNPRGDAGNAAAA